MTTSRNLQKSQTGVQEAYRLHQQLAPRTSLSVHASNSTMHGRPTITTAEETLQHATGSHLCLHNRSKRSSTLSRWCAPINFTHSLIFANAMLRRWKSTSRPNLTHISSNDYASTSWTWRLGEYLPASALGNRSTQHLRVDR